MKCHHIAYYPFGVAPFCTMLNNKRASSWITLVA